MHVNKLMLRMKLTLRYSGKKFERYKLKCIELEEVIKLIEKSHCYYAGTSIPSLDTNTICFRMTDEKKDAYISLLEENKNIISYEIKHKDFAIIRIRGSYNSDFIIVFTTEIPKFHDKRR